MEAPSLSVKFESIYQITY